MDLVTWELIVLSVITFYTDVILCSNFIDSCKTTLKFTDYESYILLNYDGASLTDSYGKPCEAVVDIKHTSYMKTKICVELYSGHDKCTRFFKFYYAEDPYRYYSCERIKFEAVCRESETLIAEFQPWSHTAEYSGNIKIHVYAQYTETPLDNNPGVSNASKINAGVGVLLGGVVVVIICIISAIVRHRKKDGNNSRQTVNQPPPARLTRFHSNEGSHENQSPSLSAVPSMLSQPAARLTRFHSNESSQGNQSPSLSAGPPNYADVMAAEDRQNNVSSTTNRGSSDITGPKVCHHLQELAIKRSASSLSEYTIPETPPPPYPGCAQYL